MSLPPPPPPPVLCVAALFLPHHPDEQPLSSPVPAGRDAAVLLWAGGGPVRHGLLPRHAHAGLHGGGGKRRPGLLLWLHF